MAEVTYRLDKQIDIGAWIHLYQHCGWNQGWTPRNAETMIRHAYLIVTAWADDDIVGTLTVLGDGLNYATIDDLVVHPAHRGHGIGSRLVGLALEQVGHLEPHLEAIPGVASFYQMLGFITNQGHTPMLWPQRHTAGREL